MNRETRADTMIRTLSALVAAEAWTTIDTLLDEIKFDGLDCMDAASHAEMEAAGACIGFLSNGPARDRESFKSVIRRFQTALEMSASFSMTGLSAEDAVSAILNHDTGKLVQAANAYFTATAKSTERPS